MKETVIFYHYDMDGRASAYLVMKYMKFKPEDVELIEVEHNARPIYKYIQEVENKNVYIVDYSFTIATVDTLLKINEIAKKVIWIDHHESSKILMDKGYIPDSITSYIYTDQGSGAMLTRTFFNNTVRAALNPLPNWLLFVSDWDTWAYAKKDKKYQDIVLAFKYGMDQEDQDPVTGIWKQLDKNYTDLKHPITRAPLASRDQLIKLSTIIQDKTLKDILETGRTIKSAIDTNNFEYLKKFGFIATFEQHECLCLNLQETSLQFGEYIKDFDFVVAFAYNGSMFTYSLYTDKDYINVRKICERHGGGGHPKAAGFPSREMVLTRTKSFLEWLKEKK